MKISDKVSWPDPLSGTAKYVVAVSGGVDSVVLLHLLLNHKRKYQLVVAHADHGWRYESKADLEFVKDLAKKNELPFEHSVLQLKTKSEAEARQARYDFLNAIRVKHNAEAIITGHHYDDWLETAIFNLIRGTNINGLASLRSTENALRPLIRLKKSEIISYANTYKLKWREDSSNHDTTYARNKIRHEVLPNLRSQNPQFDAEFTEILNKAEKLRNSLSELIQQKYQQKGLVAKNQVIIPMDLINSLQLPVLRHFLYFATNILLPGVQIDSLAISQAALQLKTGRSNRLRKLNSQLNVGVQNDTFTITVN